MTSARKIESNKRNAARSTGPRTAEGKSRSRNNARRHGLAIPLEDDSEEKERFERLAAILAEGSDDFGRIEQSRIVAECHFDLSRIRTARHDAFLTMANLENVSVSAFDDAICAIASISRYETRALSKRRHALRKSND
jgi:hypothetical protein